MRVLVTGANGFIGKNTIRRLQGAPAPVQKPWEGKEAKEVIELWGLDRVFPYPEDPDIKKLSGLVMMDLRDIMSWFPKVKFDAVIHLAAKSGVRNFTEDDYLNNVQSTDTLLKWMSREGIPMIVYASSSSVYGNCEHMHEGSPTLPISLYGKSKLECERLVHAWSQEGNTGVTFRIFNAIGADQRPDMFPSIICEHLKILRGTPMLSETPALDIFGSILRAWTYVGDVVNGFWSALDKFYWGSAKGTHILFNLGTSSSLNQRQLLSKFEDCCDVKAITYQKEPNPLDVFWTKADMRHFTYVFGWFPNPNNVDTGVNELLKQHGLKS